MSAMFPSLNKVSTNRPGPMRFTMSGFIRDNNIGSRSTDSYHNTAHEFKNRTTANWGDIHGDV